MVAYSSLRKLSMLRVALAGGFTAAVFFLLCWLGAFLPIGPATQATGMHTFASALRACVTAAQPDEAEVAS